MSQIASKLAPRPAIERLLRPRSIAIVGASTTPRALGNTLLNVLQDANYSGDLYLVNPNYTEIQGRPCVPSIDDLPSGIDCAALAIPRASVLETVRACIRRGVGSAIIFCSGFAEAGAEGRAEQEEIARIAREHNLIIQGPNCIGMVNYVDNIPLTFDLRPSATVAEGEGIALISQSGAMTSVLCVSLAASDLKLSFSISVGNEVTTGVEEFLEYLLEDKYTRHIALVVELFRNPQKFLRLAARARELGKTIVLLHPGRSSAAAASAATHTGAMAGNFKVMATKVAHAGVVLVDTIEEFIDVLQFVSFCPSLPRGGTAMATESGAFKALTLDFCETIGLDMPPLSPETEAALRQALPPFIPPSNPLDITAQALIDPDLVRRSLIPMLADDKYGCVILGLILTDATISSYKVPPVIAAYNAIKPTKPVVYAGLDEGAAIPRHYVEELRALGIPFYPSPERALRAVARLTKYAAQQDRDQAPPPAIRIPSSLPLTSGVMAEYQSKEVLKAVGIPVPAGALARSLDEAQSIAARIGFPVVLKAQAAKLAHKSDVGGVILNLTDADALASGWKRLQDNIARALPDLKLDGVLVEKMGQRGAELIVGAQNDKNWGPVLLVGFGGVLAEALKDVRLLPPELSVDAVVDELYRLKSAALLRGFRGSPTLDVRAAAEIVCSLGALMRSTPAIQEVDINPVIVYPQGQGAVALDALIVTDQQ